MRHALSIGLLLVASPALAVMPPDVYRQAAKKAAFHVQVKVSKVASPTKAFGQCRVTGKVVRVFRGKIKKGKTITFGVHCRKKGAEPPVGGVIWKQHAALERAKYLEVALDKKSKKGYVVALYNTSIIKAPSDKPQWGFPFHEN